MAKALRIASAGDRIILANTGVPYRESITLQAARHSGTSYRPFELVGNGAILDGTIPLAEADWESVGNYIFRTRPDRMSYQQLFLDDQPLVRRQPLPGQAPQLGVLEWCLLQGYIYFRCEKDRLPQSYNLTCCYEQVGITLYDVHDVIVQDLVVRGFYLDGVNAHDTVRTTDLIAITAKDNGRSGISIGGACRVRVDTCSLAGNGAAQLRTEGYCIVRTIANSIDPATAPALVQEGGRIEPETE
jgi:hypothetical protein